MSLQFPAPSELFAARLNITNSGMPGHERLAARKGIEAEAEAAAAIRAYATDCFTTTPTIALMRIAAAMHRETATDRPGDINRLTADLFDGVLALIDAGGDDIDNAEDWALNAVADYAAWFRD